MKSFIDALGDFLTRSHERDEVVNDMHSHGKDQELLHEHARGREPHRHDRHKGKTYFKHEHRSDGMPVRCEGHWSIEMGINDDWCYQ